MVVAPVRFRFVPPPVRALRPARMGKQKGNAKKQAPDFKVRPGRLRSLSIHPSESEDEARKEEGAARQCDQHAVQDEGYAGADADGVSRAAAISVPAQSIGEEKVIIFAAAPR